MVSPSQPLNVPLMHMSMVAPGRKVVQHLLSEFGKTQALFAYLQNLIKHLFKISSRRASGALGVRRFVPGPARPPNALLGEPLSAQPALGQASGLRTPSKNKFHVRRSDRASSLECLVRALIARSVSPTLSHGAVRTPGCDHSKGSVSAQVSGDVSRCDPSAASQAAWIQFERAAPMIGAVGRER